MSWRISYSCATVVVVGGGGGAIVVTDCGGGGGGGGTTTCGIVVSQKTVEVGAESGIETCASIIKFDRNVRK